MVKPLSVISQETVEGKWQMWESDENCCLLVCYTASSGIVL